MRPDSALLILNYSRRPFNLHFGEDLSKNVASFKVIIYDFLPEIEGEMTSKLGS